MPRICILLRADSKSLGARARGFRVNDGGGWIVNRAGLSVEGKWDRGRFDESWVLGKVVDCS